jgi:hypothetical protein
LGSRNYSRPPQAVLVGGGYDEEAVDKMRTAVASTQGTRKVPWVRPDLEKTRAGPTPGTEEYSKSVASRMRETLKTLERDGKLDGTADGIFFW